MKFAGTRSCTTRRTTGCFAGIRRSGLLWLSFRRDYRLPQSSKVSAAVAVAPYDRHQARCCCGRSDVVAASCRFTADPLSLRTVPLVFWKFAWGQRTTLYAAVVFPGQGSWWQWSAGLASIFLCLELVVLGYQYRPSFSLLFVLLAMWPWVGSGRTLKSARRTHLKERWRKLMSSSFCWSVSCLLLAIFPCLPSNYDQSTPFVGIGALLVLIFAFVTIRRVAPAQGEVSDGKRYLVLEQHRCCLQFSLFTGPTTICKTTTPLHSPLW